MPPTPLPELFEQYRDNNQDEAWRQRYKAAYSQIVDIREGRQNLTPEFVKAIWTEREFGSSKIYRGLLGSEQFRQAADLLTEITEKIISAKSPEAMEEVWETLKQAKNNGDIPWLPKGLTKRLLSTAAPGLYTSIAYDGIFGPLQKKLRSEYGLDIPETNDWFPADRAIRANLVASGLPDKDPYLLNTFIWYLATNNSKNIEPPPPGSDDEEPCPQEIPSFPSALNIIYCGPPGTGKTYKVREMLEAHFVTRTESLTDEEWAETLVKDKKDKEITWWEVIAAALKDLGGQATVPEIRKHKLVEAKFRRMACERTSISGRVSTTLQAHAPQDSRTVNYSGKGEPPALFDKNDDGTATWRLLPEWEKDAPGAVELQRRFRDGKPAKEAPEKPRYDVITFHQSYSYEEFVEGIRPVLDDEEEPGDEDGAANLRYRLHDGIFKKICAEARKDPKSNYALLIDEINRGNISKIFGELITLMEESKREGSPEAMETLLPYSGQPFSIPGNLYIIGTMNTADRSLALMDTALRRRFVFKRVDPDPSLLPEKEVQGVRLDLLLKTINERIEALYDKEHTIGHSYLWEVKDMGSLEFAFREQILPLLEEYFFDDWEKISLVLGDNLKKDELCFLFKEERGQRLFGTDTGRARPAPSWQYNPDAMRNPMAYKAIYEPKPVGAT